LIEFFVGKKKSKILEENWKKNFGGKLEEKFWRKIGGKLEENWRKIGGKIGGKIG